MCVSATGPQASCVPPPRRQKPRLKKVGLQLFCTVRWVSDGLKGISERNSIDPGPSDASGQQNRVPQSRRGLIVSVGGGDLEGRNTCFCVAQQ